LSIFVLFLIVSQFSIALMFNIERSHRHRRYRRAKVEPTKNKWYQLMVGVVLGAGNMLDDNSVGDLNTCLPIEWGVAVDNGKLAIDAAKAATDAAAGAVKGAQASKDASKVAPLDGFADKIVLAAKAATDGAKVVADSANAAALKLGSPVAVAVDGQDPAKAGDAKTDESGAKEKIEKAADKGTFDKVLDIVQRILDFVCKFKDKVKALFTRKYKRYMLNKKFYKFKEKSMRRNQYLMSSAGFWNDIEDKVTGFFDKIEDSLKKDWSEVKDIAAWVFNKLKDKITKAIAWVNGIINSPLVKKIVFIVGCISKNSSIATNLIATVKGITARIALLATGPVGIASVFIDLLCNLGKFRTAFATLFNAKLEKDPLIQWRKYGMFIGDLFYALGN